MANFQATFNYKINNFLITKKRLNYNRIAEKVLKWVELVVAIIMVSDWIDCVVLHWHLISDDGKSSSFEAQTTSLAAELL